MSRNKKIIIITVPIIILLIGAILTTVFLTKKPKKEKYLTLQTEYNLVRDEQFYLDVNIFQTKPKSVLEDKEAVKGISLSGENFQKELALLSTQSITETTFNKTKYYRKRYTFDLGNETESFYIQNAYITFILNNNDKYKFSIGKVSVIRRSTPQNDGEKILIKEANPTLLEGANNAFYRLKSISFKLKLNSDYSIEKVYYAKKAEGFDYVDFDVKKDDNLAADEVYLDVKIKQNQYILEKLPMVIVLKSTSLDEITVEFNDDPTIFKGTIVDLLKARGDLANEPVISYHM